MASALYSPADRRSKRDRYDRIRASLIDKRKNGSFDADWRDLGDWLMPRRTRFSTDEKNRSSTRNKNIIDSSARFAARTLESGLHAGLTSPARPWLRLTIADQNLAEHGPVKDWLHLVTKRMLDIFQMTNLYQVLPTIYGDMGCFGTGAMAVLKDDEDLFRCYHYPLGSWAIGLNRRGVSSTWVHEYRLSVRQIVEEFALQADGRTLDWSGISKAVKDAWHRGDYEVEFDIAWVVAPNLEADPDRLESRYMPFSSCHYEISTNEGKLLRDSGFRTFPIMTPRWHVTGGDAYGTDCPGMTAIGDIRQLQIMQRRKGQAIAKMIDPPLVGPPELRTQKTSLLPGDITYLSERDGLKGLRSIHEVTLNIEHLRMDIHEVRELIRRAFYEDLFLMLSQRQESPRAGVQPITAREVEERHEEKLIVLGPVLDRTHDELLDPLIDRAWTIMVMDGMVPPAPPELSGVKLRPEYTSVLAQAQKLVGVRSLDAFMGSVLQLGAVSPEVAARVSAKVDFNQVVDNYGDHYSVDPRLIRPTEEAEAMMAEAAQAAQADQAAARAQMLARAGKDAAAAPIGGQNMLERVAADAQEVVA